jgi:hypothetical protein
MNYLLAPFLRKCVLLFMDDILIYSRTLEELVQHIQQVFHIMMENKLFIKFSKCAFAQPQVEYLGHVISDKGVATDHSKVDAMINWPIPTSFTEVRGFLGLTGYHKKFVKGYGILAKPLTNLLKLKNFVWTDEATLAFHELKHAMCSAPVLTLPNFEEPFKIETDACDKEVGAVLSQAGHLVAFFSKALSVNNQKLSTYEKEFLVVLMAVDKWRHYLLRKPFVIRTGHKSLCHLQDHSLSTEM